MACLVTVITTVNCKWSCPGKSEIQIYVFELNKRKECYAARELKEFYDRTIKSLARDYVAQIYCDASVMPSGGTGCGVVIREEHGVQDEHSYRLTHGISSTQAELCALLKCF